MTKQHNTTTAKLLRLHRILQGLELKVEHARTNRDDAIRAARAKGAGIREIARLLDLDPGQVTRICQREKA